MELFTIIFSAMLSLSPADKVLPVDKIDETEEQRQERLADIARTIVRIVEEEKPLGSGPNGREYGAAMILAVTHSESGGWRREVDLGINRAKRAKKGEEDHGRSWCLGQINLGKGKVPVGDDVMKSWDGPALIADHYKCLKVAFLRIRGSLGSCASNQPYHRLNQYTTGVCKVNPDDCKGDKVCLERQETRMKVASARSRDKVQLASLLLGRFASHKTATGATVVSRSSP